MQKLSVSATADVFQHADPAMTSAPVHEARKGAPRRVVGIHDAVMGGMDRIMAEYRAGGFSETIRNFSA